LQFLERQTGVERADFVQIIWDVATGNRLEDLTGQLTYFTAVAWSPDGDRLVAGGTGITPFLQVRGRLVRGREPRTGE
jgi:WD40 repeat protein